MVNWTRAAPLALAILAGCGRREMDPNKSDALLQQYVPGAGLAQAVGDLRGAKFSPYDGYALTLAQPLDGLEQARFLTAFPIPDSPPAPGEPVIEVVLTGRAPNAAAIRNRAVAAFGSAPTRVGCIELGAGGHAIVMIWEDRHRPGGGGVELVAPGSGGTAAPSLTFFSGPWTRKRVGSHYSEGPCVPLQAALGSGRRSSFSGQATGPRPPG
jgi:hypothetical protein